MLRWSQSELRKPKLRRAKDVQALVPHEARLPGGGKRPTEGHEEGCQSEVSDGRANGTSCRSGRETHYLRVSQKAGDRLTTSGRLQAHAREGGFGVRKGGREKEDARWGVLMKLCTAGRARASSAAPISRRRCARFLKRNTRQANNRIEMVDGQGGDDNFDIMIAIRNVQTCPFPRFFI